MIALFGGTTEGKTVAAFLDGMGRNYIYSTKTAGASLPMKHGRSRSGALDEAGMADFFTRESVNVVVDAAHPFAIGLHRTIDRVAGVLDLPVIRYERDYRLAEEQLCDVEYYYVSSLRAAIRKLRELQPTCPLAATGVQTLRSLRPYWSGNAMKARILLSCRSAMLAREAGFPPGDLIMMDPPATVEDETRCLQAYGIDCLVTKESGSSGFLPEKMAAARRLGIPVIIVRRPVLPASFTVVESVNELAEVLERVIEGG